MGADRTFSSMPSMVMRNPIKIEGSYEESQDIINTSSKRYTESELTGGGRTILENVEGIQ